MTTTYLMNPETGSVDTRETWAATIVNAVSTYKDCKRQFDLLIKVEKDSSGEWVEVK